MLIDFAFSSNNGNNEVMPVGFLFDRYNLRGGLPMPSLFHGWQGFLVFSCLTFVILGYIFTWLVPFGIIVFQFLHQSSGVIIKTDKIRFKWKTTKLLRSFNVCRKAFITGAQILSFRMSWIQVFFGVDDELCSFIFWLSLIKHLTYTCNNCVFCIYSPNTFNLIGELLTAQVDFCFFCYFNWILYP